ncbi:MAG: RnfABCDGE type electron transport complex subunit G [Lentimicrobiaceae bacterium]|nr:RnfABCDGE type electron transport complex subunit G [Lentimicrobiaceae bacterium]
MSKKENSIWQLITALTSITVVATIALSCVYLATKEPIKQIKIAKDNAAKVMVLPGFDPASGVFVQTKALPEGLKDSLTVTLAYMNNQLFGAAVATHTNIAFSGRFDIMVGFDHEGNILNTEVLGHQETPGLGDKIDKKKDKFPLQFAGRTPKEKPLSVRKDGGDIDAITAATISSRAFCNAVNYAYQAYQMVLQDAEIINNNNITEKEENHE